MTQRAVKRVVLVRVGQKRRKVWQKKVPKLLSKPKWVSRLLTLVLKLQPVWVKQCLRKVPKRELTLRQKLRQSLYCAARRLRVVTQKKHAKHLRRRVVQPHEQPKLQSVCLLPKRTHLASSVSTMRKALK